MNKFGDRCEAGSAAVLLVVGVAFGAAASIAAGSAGRIAVERAHAETVSEIVVAAMASDRVSGYSQEEAESRSRDIALRNGAKVLRLVEIGERISATIEWSGSHGTSAAVLEW
ncbi:hypothetical protein IMCC26256_11223 [Actinobacteria bacterium IMCC26256]|nr:hypothetical protein IMCC26256_11223 [Actinobacteria bacterium IMCC26256]